MSSSGREGQPTRHTIKSDKELIRYLKGQLRATDADFNKTPILEYSSQRDFAVEPLETGATAYLINVLLEDTSAQPENNFVLECWVPNNAGKKSELESKLDQWGYDVVHRKRTNRSIKRTPLINYTAKRSPSPLAQFRALCETGLGTPELLDGWVLVVKKRHQSEVEGISAKEWASIRGVPIDEVKTNASRLGDALQENGGIPGTQREIHNDDGVTVTYPRSESNE